MATQPIIPAAAHATYRMWRFVPGAAPVVAAWIRDLEEGYWTAPKSSPPIDAAEILRWQIPGHDGYLLTRGESRTPIGYGEVNAMIGGERRFWLGHIIVDPNHRGIGAGRELVHRLTRRAIEFHAAQSVALVVFPKNVPAIECYRSVGFTPDGFEDHEIAWSKRTERLLRMIWRRT